MERKKAVITQAELNYRQAVDLFSLSPDKSKQLLTESQKNIKDYQLENPEFSQDEQLADLYYKITREMEKISRQYASEPQLFLDLGLIKEGFKAQKWQLNGQEAVLLDEDQGNVIKINFGSKKGEILAGGEEVRKVKLVARNPGYSYLVSNKEILMINEKTLKKVAAKEIKDLGLIKDAVGFSGNLYLLGENQIYKFIGLEADLSDKQDYLKENDDSLKEDEYLAIDGSVWTLSKNGYISKYVRGKRDFFSISGLDKEIKAGGFFTDENCQNLYILDQQNTLVVVINKDGQYQRSYFWPGLAGAYDLAVLEEQGKIFILTGERVYEMKME